MTKKEKAQLHAIEENVIYDKEKKVCTVNYTYITDPSVLAENYEQVKTL